MCDSTYILYVHTVCILVFFSSMLATSHTLYLNNAEHDTNEKKLIIKNLKFGGNPKKNKTQSRKSEKLLRVVWTYVPDKVFVLVVRGGGDSRSRTVGGLSFWAF